MPRLFLWPLLLAALLLASPSWAMPNQDEEPGRNVDLSKPKKLEVRHRLSDTAAKCVECHSKKTPGKVHGWKKSAMAQAGVSCYDCHHVKKTSPMAGQCEGLENTDTYISPMVSPKTCKRCHPQEVKQFRDSNHSKRASEIIVNNEKMKKLQHHYEGLGNMGVPEDAPKNHASLEAGCQMCHGGKVKLGPDNRPIDGTWPGGVGHRYPDGGIGNCTVCHTRHQFSVAEARKPEACASCHLGPDHPNIEIYEESKHGQIFAAHGEEWTWDSAPDTWEPGSDFTAPTCAACHISGLGELETTHDIDRRLQYDLMHKRSVVRSGSRGNGEEGKERMKKVCLNCHGKTHVRGQRQALDNTVELYNTYWDKAVEMKKELKEKGLLKEDPWQDPYQELMYYLWHHTGRRARQGTAMNGPDYTHWHGFFQMFQVLGDMKAIYEYRLEHGKIEELSPVMSSGPT